MKLTVEKIREITTGAVRVTEENGKIKFYRFTEEQENLYKISSEDFYKKALSTSGVKLSFKTNSKRLFLDVKCVQGSSREYFSFDIFVNGKLIDSLGNFSESELPAEYAKLKFNLGEFSKEFELGEGIKTVCVHFPWSQSVSIKNLILDDGAFVEGVRPEKKLLAFGDSITQGYDALHPSNRYIAKLAEKLGAEEFNKGIGGEIFFPALAELKDSFVPDYITVAYGTNDWNCTDEETFRKNCKAFYENLRKNYPDTVIFAITPIWRKDLREERKFGSFDNVGKIIEEIVKDIDNIFIVRGFDFIPKEEKYFADLNLHPNDEGFGFYAEKLYNEIKQYKNI